MITIEIRTYMTAAGQSPFSKWLAELDAQDRVIVRTRIDRMRLGIFGDAKHIKGGEGVWENEYE